MQVQHEVHANAELLCTLSCTLQRYTGQFARRAACRERRFHVTAKERLAMEQPTEASMCGVPQPQHG